MSSAKQANWNLGCSLLLTVVLVGGVLFYFRVKIPTITFCNLGKVLKYVSVLVQTN